MSNLNQVRKLSVDLNSKQL